MHNKSEALTKFGNFLIPELQQIVCQCEEKSKSNVTKHRKMMTECLHLATSNKRYDSFHRMNKRFGEEKNHCHGHEMNN